jgi:virginiamycin B lyase
MLTSLVAAGVVLLLAAAPAGAVTITEFPVGAGPRYIHPGPDGNIWFAYSAGIGRISPAGERFAPILNTHSPVDLVNAADGSVYWSGDAALGLRTANGAVYGGRITAPAYAIALTATGELRWSLPGSGICRYTLGFDTLPILCSGLLDTTTRVTGLALGPDGRLWAAAYDDNRVRRMTADGNGFDLVLDMPVGSGPARVAVGPDGNLWVTMFDASAIDRFTPAGARTRFPLPPGAGPNDIVAGPDGALWFTEYSANKIGRMTTDGALTNEFPIPTAHTQPIGITAGPDGAIWFTESTAGIVGRLRLDPPQTPGAGGGGTVADRVAPRFVRRPTLKPARFRSGRASTLTFTLSEAAQVTFTVARRRSGRRVGRTCVAPTRSNRDRRRCTRYATVATLRRAGLQGANTVRFGGRVGGRALRPGTYRLTASARDAAGNRASAPAASFTVLAR